MRETNTQIINNRLKQQNWCGVAQGRSSFDLIKGCSVFGDSTNTLATITLSFCAIATNSNMTGLSSVFDRKKNEPVLLKL